MALDEACSSSHLTFPSGKTRFQWIICELHLPNSAGLEIAMSPQDRITRYRLYWKGKCASFPQLHQACPNPRPAGATVKAAQELVGTSAVAGHTGHPFIHSVLLVFNKVTWPRELRTHREQGYRSHETTK